MAFSNDGLKSSESSKIGENVTGNKDGEGGSPVKLRRTKSV